jgi:hypothetical protein
MTEQMPVLNINGSVSRNFPRNLLLTNHGDVVTCQRSIVLTNELPDRGLVLKASMRRRFRRRYSSVGRALRLLFNRWEENYGNQTKASDRGGRSYSKWSAGPWWNVSAGRASESVYSDSPLRCLLHDFGSMSGHSATGMHRYRGTVFSPRHLRPASRINLLVQLALGVGNPRIGC